MNSENISSSKFKKISKTSLNNAKLNLKKNINVDEYIYCMNKVNIYNIHLLFNCPVINDKLKKNNIDVNKDKYESKIYDQTIKALEFIQSLNDNDD